jgi:hypothetical protein
MNYGVRIVAMLVVVAFFSNLCAQDNAPAAPGGVNLKVGENFFFEGKIEQKEDDQKEASMAEIKRVPFYETTWFIAIVSVVAIAGAGTGIYFATKTPAPEGKVLVWNSQSGK